MVDESWTKEMAEVTDEVKRLKKVIVQFIQSCSHSMRSPLKTIQGLVTLLKQAQNYPEQEVKTFLELITTSTFKMEYMLDELEQFLENSRREVVIQSTDLKELIQETIEDFSTEFEKHQIQPVVKVEQHIQLRTDSNRLRMVLINMIDNAIRFHDESKSERIVDIRANVNFRSCLITISDNGTGIEEQYHSDIFKLYFRGSQRSNGLGMGLHIASEAVGKMGGSITVDSREGMGSKFIIWFPNMLETS